MLIKHCIIHIRVKLNFCCMTTNSVISCNVNGHSYFEHNLEVHIHKLYRHLTS